MSKESRRRQRPATAARRELGLAAGRPSPAPRPSARDRRPAAPRRRPSRPARPADGHGPRDLEPRRPPRAPAARRQAVVHGALSHGRSSSWPPSPASPLIGVFVFFSASQPAYACSTIWPPAPTASPAAGATPHLGYVQPDMGASHVGLGDEGDLHVLRAGLRAATTTRPAAPIAARVYGPSDNVIPQGWIHNLEHGGLVILYQGTARAPHRRARRFRPCSTRSRRVRSATSRRAGSAARSSPASTRWRTPFQAIVWGRVLPLETCRPAAILAF